MLKIFFDSNVIIDALSQRENSQDSINLVQEVILGNIKGYLSTKQITDIYYVLKRHGFNENERVDLLKIISKYFLLLPTFPSDINYSLSNYKCGDFEDLVIDNIAKVNCVDFLVTSNNDDYKSSRNKIVTPKQLNDLLHLL